MNAQDLKNSILQLAIQGKLVEQREEEGSAKELLKNIEAAKIQLTKEGKIKKQKALPDIKEDETPFDIPESWEWARLGDCVSNKSGVSYKKHNLTIKTNNMIRVLRGGNISDLEYCFKDDDILIDSSFVKDELILSKNTLITPAVTSLQHIGKMARIDKNYDNVAVGGFVLMLIPYIDLDIFSQYMLFALSSHYHRSICRTITNKSGQAFYNLSREKLMNVLVPIPPLEEQNRIVAKILELMPYVDEYGVAYSEVEELNRKFPVDMQKSILQYGIQGKLVEQLKEDGMAEELYQQIQEEKKKLIKEHKMKKEKPLPEIKEEETLFEIPMNWKWVRLGDIVSVRGGKRLPPGKKLTQEKTNHVYIRVTDMKNQTIDDTDLHYISNEIHDKISNYIIEKSDVYIVIVGSTIGKVGLVPEKFHGMNLTENAARLIPICVDREYLMRYLTTLAAQTQFIDLTKQVGQPKLALTRLKNILVPLPPLKEQKRIVEKIEDLLSYTKKMVN